MNCTVVERWLDEGMPATGAAAARAHAARCPLCGPRLLAAARVEAVLASVARAVPAAPAGFADRVMSRVAATERIVAPAADAPAAPAAHRLPLWLRVGADPAIPLALAFASAAFGLGRAALILAQRPLPAAPPAIDLGALGPLLAGSPLTQVAVVVAILPLLILASLQIFHGTQWAMRTRSHRS